MVAKPMTPMLGDSHGGAAHEQVQSGGYTYAISVDRDGHFRWTLFAPNGQIVGASAVGFASELTAERALQAEAEHRSVPVPVSPRFGGAA